MSLRPKRAPPTTPRIAPDRQSLRSARSRCTPRMRDRQIETPLPTMTSAPARRRSTYSAESPPPNPPAVPADQPASHGPNPRRVTARATPPAARKYKRKALRRKKSNSSPKPKNAIDANSVANTNACPYEILRFLNSWQAIPLMSRVAGQTVDGLATSAVLCQKIPAGVASSFDNTPIKTRSNRNADLEHALLLQSSCR